ncbi:hypothetical protein CLOM_g13553 [Closterium sp. NIES-68]|nr:hypothetical protein CLOM_g13553 [Closterium sp. NIES-68]GJP68295.1 hypothetical protein CLOP_g25025 [Closterium sp. NIES-67]
MTAIVFLVLLAVAVGQCDALLQARQGFLKHYNVRLRSALPLAAYRGGFSIFPGWTDDEQAGNASVPAALTAAPTTLAAEARTMVGRGIPRRARLSMENPQIRAHADLLEYQQTTVAASVGLSADRIAYRFKYSQNGFSASLTPLQARRLRRHAAVAAVQESREVQRLTTDSPTFLGMGSSGSLWSSNGGQSKAGDGMVIAVVDTGIWPEHPSFSDSGFSSTKPAGWTGKCDTTTDFKCNNKVIGARAMYAGFTENNGAPDLSADWLSPRDSQGHGTWCAGASAGNKDVSMAGGKASGMAPAARLAIYKVFWTKASGRNTASTTDVMAAIDQAVADGADVISLSLGTMDPTATYFDDVPLLYANLAGVFVAFAAGNSGSPKGTNFDTYRQIANFAPFYLTVGASSILRDGAVLPKADNLSSSAILSTYPMASAAPEIASFSSAGPLCRPWTDASSAQATNSILKPDVVGPGVKLYAAAPGKTVGETGTYSQKSGTSMATPHLAGIGALILQKYPTWSPAQVMSAIMTTAVTSNTDDSNIKDVDGNTATPWEMGQGHVYPPKVLDPGLTYDARAAYYMNFLAGQSLKQAKLEFPNARLVRMPPRNLNRASISVSRLKGTLTVSRLVTNVAGSESTYKVKIKAPKGVSVTVSPKKFTIAAGQRLKYVVTLTVKTPSKDFQFGSLTWKDGDGHSVRSVLAIQPVAT